MELPTVGAQCAMGTCSQLDFLPVRCRHCAKHFCGSHFKPAVHACPRYVASAGPGASVGCPICDKSIDVGDTLDGGADVNALVAQHMDSGACVPKKKGNPHCAIERCKTKGLGHNCGRCGLKLCVDHLRSEHGCITPAARAATARAAAAAAAAPPRPEPRAPAAAAPRAEPRAAGAQRMDIAPAPAPAPAPAVTTSTHTAVISAERLRREALGDPSVPAESRRYFYVFYPVETGLPFGTAVYFADSWTLADASRYCAESIGLEPGDLCLYDAGTGTALVDDLPLGFLDGHLASGAVLLLERRAREARGRLEPAVFAQHGLAIPAN